MPRRAVIPIGAVSLFAACALLAASTARSAPAADRGADAFAMLQEEQTVTGAAKRPQPLSETPSEVTVITWPGRGGAADGRMLFLSLDLRPGPRL